jgi:hypothetical protein
VSWCHLESRERWRVCSARWWRTLAGAGDSADAVPRAPPPCAIPLDSSAR